MKIDDNVYSRGQPLNPDFIDYSLLGISAVALVVIGALGVTQILPSAAVGASFLFLGIATPLVLLCRSKSLGAWSSFFCIYTPLVAALGAASLAGRLSLRSISGLSITLGSLLFCSDSIALSAKFN